MRKFALPGVLLVMGAVAVACESGPATSPNSEVPVPQLSLLPVGCPDNGNPELLGNSETPNGDGQFCVVAIDIKPGSDPNSINCNNESNTIAVAILSTSDFDAKTVDHTTVTFEGASETHVNRRTRVARRHEEDVDGDGDTDLVLHFRLGDTDLTCRSTYGALTGFTVVGQEFVGTDLVRMIGGGGDQD